MTNFTAQSVIIEIVKCHLGLHGPQIVAVGTQMQDPEPVQFFLNLREMEHVAHLQRKPEDALWHRVTAQTPIPDITEIDVRIETAYCTSGLVGLIHANVTNWMVVTNTLFAQKLRPRQSREAGMWKLPEPEVASIVEQDLRHQTVDTSAKKCADFKVRPVGTRNHKSWLT